MKTFSPTLSPRDLFQSIGRFLLIGGILVGSLAGCDSSPTASSPPKASNPPVAQVDNTTLSKSSIHSGHTLPRIVAFGNSLTAGLGIPQNQAYPAQLQYKLHEAGYHYEVINAGVSGDTTAGGLRRLKWVLNSQPSIVIVELGANDGLRGHRLKETKANLESIIQGFQQAGVTVILAGMKIPPNYGERYTRQFEGMYQELAEAYDLPFIPFFLKGVAAHPDLNQADGLHPTAEGYQIVVTNLMPVLEPFLAPAP